MKLKNVKITFLIDRDRTSLQVHDSDAGITFVSIELTPAQLSDVLARHGHAPVASCEVMGLDKIGKQHESEMFEFEIPKSLYETRYALRSEKSGALNQKALRALTASGKAAEGWSPDNYYGSQGSCFQREGKYYARAIIRRWVDKTDAETAVEDNSEEPHDEIDGDVL